MQWYLHSEFLSDPQFPHILTYLGWWSQWPLQSNTPASWVFSLTFSPKYTSFQVTGLFFYARSLLLHSLQVSNKPPYSMHVSKHGLLTRWGLVFFLYKASIPEYSQCLLWRIWEMKGWLLSCWKCLTCKHFPHQFSQQNLSHILHSHLYPSVITIHEYFSSNASYQSECRMTVLSIASQWESLHVDVTLNSSSD